MANAHMYAKIWWKSMTNFWKTTITTDRSSAIGKPKALSHILDFSLSTSYLHFPFYWTTSLSLFAFLSFVFHTQHLLVCVQPKVLFDWGFCQGPSPKLPPWKAWRAWSSSPYCSAKCLSFLAKRTWEQVGHESVFDLQSSSIQKCLCFSPPIVPSLYATTELLSKRQRGRLRQFISAFSSPSTRLFWTLFNMSSII